jgi:multicomponent Na+:H+ antiporter subunit B
MRKCASLLLIVGFLFYTGTLAGGIFSGPAQQTPGEAGRAILADSPQRAGSANTVTSVVVLYRGFDTLGEVTVLFLSAMGVALLLNAFGTKREDKAGRAREAAEESGFILRSGAKILLPFFFLFGLYVISHGHLSPGGGFPGGVIIATGFFTALLTGAVESERKRLLSLLEGLAGLSFIGLGLAGLFAPVGSFLAQIFQTGEFGTLFSAGSIPLIYAVVGVKVAAELSGAVGTLYASIGAGEREDTE